MKLFILLCLVSCVKLESPASLPKKVLAPPPIISWEPIAMVKYGNTIWHCQDIVKTECGYTIHCKQYSFHCANDLVVEYLN